MKKVGLLTFYTAINYGTVLQAYALQKKVVDLGFDSEIINYRLIIPTDTTDSSPKKNIFGKLLKRIISPVSNFKHLVRRFEILILKRFDNYLFRKDIDKQNGSFRKFKEKYLAISEKSYHSKKDLESVESIYDGVIAGSDQVWNPLITQNDLVYFLNFLSDSNKRISYAASFGFVNIPEDFKAKIAPELQKIEHLSVREGTGVEIIKSISGRDAQVVLDPALLVTDEEWNGIIPEKRINEPYIFAYAFMGSPKISKLCKHLAKITGFKIVRLSLYPKGLQRTREYLDNSTTYVNDSGPAEFLSYLKNASIVVTNSFHGTVFSINFHKDFFVIPPEYNIERITDLLDLYKLSDRLQKKSGSLPAKNDIEVNYSIVEPILKSERVKSIEFLKNSLNSL